MREAEARGADYVVFPELALTTFFPRWWMEEEAAVAAPPAAATSSRGILRRR